MNQLSDQELIDGFAQVLGYTDREQEGLLTGRRTVQWGDSDLATALGYLRNQKPAFAFLHLYPVLENWLPYLNSFSLAHIEGQQEPMAFRLLPYLREINRRGKQYQQQILLDNRNRLSGSWLFNPEEIETGKAADPYLWLSANKAIEEKLFKLYQYRGLAGVHPITAEVGFSIYPTVGISHSLEGWFSFLQKQSDWVSEHSIERKTAIVTLFLKLDPISPHYASFIVSIHYGNSIWLATDQLDFNNPQNRATSRRPDRRKEKHYEHIGLPYEWVDQLDAFRSEYSGLVTGQATERIAFSRLEAEQLAASLPQEGSNQVTILTRLTEQVLADRQIAYSDIRLTPESEPITLTIYHQGAVIGVSTLTAREEAEFGELTLIWIPDILNVPLGRMPIEGRTFLVSLVERLLEELCMSPPTQTLQLASDYLQGKLLGGETFDPLRQTETTDEERPAFVGWKDVHRKRAEELIASLEGEDQKALSVQSYALVQREAAYDPNWLATPGQLETLMKWTVLYKQAKQVKTKLHTQIAEREKQDHQTLWQQLNARIEPITRLLLQASPYWPVGECYNHTSFTDTPQPVDVRWLEWTAEAGLTAMGEPTPNRQHFGYSGSSYTHFQIGLPHDYYVHYESNRKYLCPICQTRGIRKPMARLKIVHYEQLMGLLGTGNRQELPPYYRNFKAYAFLPYYGNSILQNVHPYAQLKDPCSDQYPNGLNLHVYTCKTCLNRLKKELGYLSNQVGGVPPAQISIPTRNINQQED